MAMNGILSKGSCGHSCSVVKCWKWKVNDIFDHHHSKYAVVVLNRTISQNQEVIKRVWNNASLRITVDGGTVHWDKFIHSLSESDQKTMQLPDLITGDFDSITKDVLQKYKKKGCKTVHTPDQDHTDFTKALIELNNYCEEHQTKMDDVLVVAQTSGRIDQILGNIQTLHLVKVNHLVHPNTRIYIMSDDSLLWLLQPGDHIIDIPQESRKHERAGCSLIPVGEPCTNVTTSGLKWNLDNQELKFGKLVSTSNAFDGSEQVKIKCSHTLLWSMKVPSLTLSFERKRVDPQCARGPLVPHNTRSEDDHPIVTIEPYHPLSYKGYNANAANSVVLQKSTGFSPSLEVVSHNFQYSAIRKYKLYYVDNIACKVYPLMLFVACK